MGPEVAWPAAVAIVALLAVPTLTACLGWNARATAASEAEKRFLAERGLDEATIKSLRAEIDLLRKGAADASAVAQDQVNAAAHLASPDDRSLWRDPPDSPGAGSGPASPASVA